ncbi:unnamed protein product [Rotaria sp. Silwood2]|nr:unnamed protein product [Rotaria sp. Silwood2]CAF3123359.1 unnamed protein product [Rotaria sp. Silwood2]CAF3182357.1 unnamed protein product [Rotaria sp. Silwood2]CAF3312610.1 unnamed protein product [Rotaria sp. Silwood2]CAF3983315.1 unnamed protein product [Rotaria sp. Silwood2]
MAFLQRNEIGIKDIGRSVTVPGNDVAKLMYYLNCVCFSIDCNDDPDIRRLTNYDNWSSLSVDEQKKLLVLCYAFSPDVFDNKVFFQSDALCQNSSNKFYEISQIRHQVLAVSTIVVAGRARQVNKIMTYTMSWMRLYYLEPMQRLAKRLADQQPQRQRQSSTCIIS